ncbi:MAG: DUF6345 domain-containing protein [Chloroflexota bacterium]|nr:DUF6345 domain-containing protein [Chloroflexota bacterium]
MKKAIALGLSVILIGVTVGFDYGEVSGGGQTELTDNQTAARPLQHDKLQMELDRSAEDVKDHVGFCYITGDSSWNKFYLHREDETTLTVRYKKLSTYIPITGDWDGDSDDDVGFCELTGDTLKNKFYLRQDDGTTTVIRYKKLSTYIPVTGDWDGDGDDDIGFCELTGDTLKNKFYLRNGDGTTTTIRYKKLSNLVPITGDWDGGDDIDEVGFCELTGDTLKNKFYLRNGNGTTTTIPYKKLSSLVPITGDWNGGGDDEVGFCKLTDDESKNIFLLRNDGGSTTAIRYKKLSTLVPVTGDWYGLGDDWDPMEPEVVVEWIEDYDGTPLTNLPNAEESASGFYDCLGNNGWTKRFNKGDHFAQEADFEVDGLDYEVVDAVDIVWFEGHGGEGKIFFGQYSFGDGKVNYNEAEWGDGDVEWIFLNACETLADDGGSTKASGKFAQALNGVHLICGAVSELHNYPHQGYDVAERLIGTGGLDPMTVRWAWFEGIDETEDSDVTLRVIAENEDCLNDYIWKIETGPVADPPVDQSYTYRNYTCKDDD